MREKLFKQASLVVKYIGQEKSMRGKTGIILFEEDDGMQAIRFDEGIYKRENASGHIVPGYGGSAKMEDLKIIGVEIDLQGSWRVLF